LIAAILTGLTLISGGILVLTRGETLFSQSVLPDFSSQSSTVKPETASTPEVSDPININTASQAELESLPGIGPVIAQRIIDYRKKNGPFKRKEDIQKVKGIGPKTFADLKDKITIE
jgi:competence protein ComEA